MLIALANDSGAWIVIVVALAIFMGVAGGLFSRGGSEITAHPRGGERDETTGSDVIDADAEGELPGSEGRRFPASRGTR